MFWGNTQKKIKSLFQKKLPIQQKKYQCAVCNYASNKLLNIKRNDEGIHALPNTSHIKTNNIPVIPPIVKTPNLNSNVNPVKEKLEAYDLGDTGFQL